MKNIYFLGECMVELRAMSESKLHQSFAGDVYNSAVYLKRLGDLLTMTYIRICRTLFYEGCLPEAWKPRLIVPIYKEGSIFQPGNYRGVHLTSILSKLAE